MSPAKVSKRTSLGARFIGAGSRLEEALAGQVALANDAAAQHAVASVAKVEEVGAGDILIHQDDVGTDLFFILAGSFRVFVNGREVAVRRAGEHVGEMALIDPASRRTASVVAAEPCVVAKISEGDLLEIADGHPAVWRALAKELAKRLDARRRFFTTPNPVPNIFLGSSREALPIAEAVRDGIPRGSAHCLLWSEGVFGASAFPIDDLEAQLKVADLAVLILAPDDSVKSRGRRSRAPRDNVIFELGLFIGGLTRRRVFLLSERGVPVKIPTDLLGLTPLPPYTGSGATLDVTGAVTELRRVIQQEGPK